MRIALVGLSGSGKTTLFNALTGAHVSVGTYAGGVTPSHIGQIRVDDPRLDLLKRLIKPAKVTPALVDVMDTPTLAVGPHENKEGNARLMASLREAQALTLVLRAFENGRVPHPLESLDPARDLREILAELVVADLDLVEKRLRRIATDFQRGHIQPGDAKEQAALERVKVELDAGRSARGAKLNPDELRLLTGFALLTLKPMLIVVNVDEDLLTGSRARAWDFSKSGLPSLEVDAEWEMEIHELPRSEWPEYLAEMKIASPCDARFTDAAWRMMDLVTFFTANENEVRAWPVRRFSTAVEAAAAVHSDMARGFIRAEVVALDDLRKLGSLKDVRAHGKERVEGKTGPILDGDLVHFRFSV